ncbi:hypothetical protein K3495_g12581 [Podosphaera aphanis]|nr:hypothetical protein K3495_g12581 [Podosphaera aphanis]
MQKTHVIAPIPRVHYGSSGNAKNSRDSTDSQGALWFLDDHSSVTSFDTEVKAAAEAMSAALQLSSARFANDLWILLDNQDVARRLFSSPVCFSQTEFLQFADKAKSWGNRPRLPHTRPGQVRVAWIPGHSSIPGNDHADILARSGLSSISTPSAYSYDAAKLWALSKTEAALKEFWNSYAPQSYRDLQIINFERCPKELSFPRPLVAHIYAARSGHGDFSSYHLRFAHIDALNECSCGYPKSPSHFIYCRLPSKRVPRPPRNVPNVFQFLIVSKIGTRKLITWLENTKFYSEICPKFSPVSLSEPQLVL